MDKYREFFNKVNIAQKYLRKTNNDAWVVYQFINQNPFFDSLIGVKKIASRRTLLIVPKKGKPKIIHSKVDNDYKDLNIKELIYISYEDFIQVLNQALKGVKSIAMEYSANSKIPHISKADAGIVEVIRSLGIKIVSSGDLLQITSPLTNKQIQSHKKAAKILDNIRKETFTQIEKDIKSGKKVTEYSIQQLILKKIKQEGLETVFEPLVNINENAAKGHYLPTKDNCKQLKKGDILLIDMWAKLKGENNIYSDMTWMIYYGNKPPEKLIKIFNSVKKARDSSVKYIRKKVKKNQKIFGWQVDKVAKDSIRKDGYHKYVRTRLGHSLGTFVHGDLVHFDNFENKDERQVMKGHLGTIEPGIYIPGEFGVRSEINILVKENDVEITTEKQDGIYLIGK
jgi:Xaa-Pro aminopeptidase